MVGDTDGVLVLDCDGLAVRACEGVGVVVREREGDSEGVRLRVPVLLAVALHVGVGLQNSFVPLIFAEPTSPAGDHVARWSTLKKSPSGTANPAYVSLEGAMVYQLTLVCA